MGGAAAEPCASHRPPFQHQLLGAGASSRRVTGTETAAHLRWALPFPHLGMPLVCPGPCVPSPRARRGWLFPGGFCLPSL